MLRTSLVKLINLNHRCLKNWLEREKKRVKTNKQTNKKAPLQCGNYKNSRGKEFKRKRRGSQIPCCSIWIWVWRCKDKHFKGGKSRGFCLPWGWWFRCWSWRKLPGNRGSLCLECKGIRSFAERNAREPPELTHSRAWNSGKGEQKWEKGKWGSLRTPSYPPPAYRVNGQDSGKISKLRVSNKA